MGSTKSQRLRRELVRQLGDSGQLRSAPVRDAFLAIPREVFIPGFAAKNRFEDVYKPQEAIPTRLDDMGISISSSSAPSIMAIMLEQLALEPGHKVLEIGTGTGYNAALLKHIVGPRGRVTSIDIDGRNTREAKTHLKRAGSSVRVVTGDGRKGVTAGAPYDRIIATVSSINVPRAWFRQTRIGGRIVVPLNVSTSIDTPQLSVGFEKLSNALRSVDVSTAGFMGMRETQDSPSAFVRHFAVQLRGGGEPDRLLAIYPGEILKRFDSAQASRVLAWTLNPERSRKVALTGPEWWTFAVFMALTVPEEHLFIGPGLIDANAKSLAYLMPGREGTTLHSSGGVWAERKILGALERWTQRGRPSVDRLRIEATYGGSMPPRGRTSTRGECTLGFHWTRGAS
ncbi:MAG: methyltransferase domain-containing protein [Actinomycetota bacterium]